MSSGGVGRLHVVEGMMNGEKYKEVLRQKLLPTMATLFPGGGSIFQDDNAPCHRSAKVRQWLTENNVERMEWGPQSPDLNPIENLWQQVARYISKNKPKTKVQLIEEVIKAWHQTVSNDLLKSLVESMPKRCRLVIASKGHSIKY